MNIGDISVTSVLDGVGHFDPTQAFAGSSETDWIAHRDLLNPDGTFDLAYGGFLVRSGDRIVLVDAGVGDSIKYQGREFPSGRLLENLGLAGVLPEQVTDVVLTHLHYDHVGWTTRKGEIVFPNATYRCHQADWDYFAADGKPAARKLGPVAGQLETWDSDRTLVPGVDVLHAPGHTPGSSMVVLSSGADRAILIGDVIHCPVQLLDDEWSAIADVDPAQARITRRALERELESGPTVPIAASHFPGLAFGRLVTSQAGSRWSWD